LNICSSVSTHSFRRQLKTFFYNLAFRPSYRPTPPRASDLAGLSLTLCALQITYILTYIQITQSKAAADLRRGGKLYNVSLHSSSLDCNTERIIEISQSLLKLSQKKQWHRFYGPQCTCVSVCKPNKALDENSSLSYGTSPAVWDHTMLPATRHK